MPNVSAYLPDELHVRLLAVIKQEKATVSGFLKAMIEETLEEFDGKRSRGKSAQQIFQENR
jgi:hypothetical protein